MWRRRRARITKEVDATETMVERVEKRFALKPDRIAGDTAYGHRNGLGETRGRFRGISAQLVVSQPWYRAAMAANPRELRGKYVGPSKTGETR